MRSFLIFIFYYSLFSPLWVNAQAKQILSVTPPLFQIEALPGDIWQSSIKVVNGNPYPLIIYADVVNFESLGETGQANFVPVPKDGAGDTTLAEWIELPKGPYTIPPEKTQEITFFAEIPKNTPPGGYYASIMISTEEQSANSESQVLTSQAVTSLLFLRINGEVHEQGDIREFRVLDSFVGTPEAEFSLRFENKGTVHILPRGNITITNMWGTERGQIPVNYNSHYGNVLPKSIRDFTFAWKSDFKFTDIGRYKADAVLSYGESGMKTVESIAYFWVIPVKWTFITLFVLGTFIYLIVRMVRAYVKRMLMLAGVDVEEMERARGIKNAPQNLYTRPHTTYRTVSAPIRDGVLDLRKRLDESSNISVTHTILSFMGTYKYFFISVLLLILMFVIISLYIGSATDSTAKYEVKIHDGDRTETLTNDDVSALTN